MKLWIRSPRTNDLRGPFTDEELERQINTGEVRWDDEALEAAGQTHGVLKRSKEWRQLRHVWAPDQTSVRIPQVPEESDHCFILYGDERRGPYLPDQIREMWKYGSITADASLVWGDVQKPISITEYLGLPQSARIEPSSPDDRGSGIMVLGVIMFIAGLIGLLYYWQMFDTSVASGAGGTRVHNLGLMQDRQSGMLISGVAATLGLVCILSGHHSGRQK